MRLRLVWVLLLALVLGCGPAATGGLSSGGIKRGSGDNASLVAEGDAAWAQRADRAQLELAIQKWEQAVQQKDDDWKTYEKLARALYLLADGWMFFEKDESEEKKAQYLATFEKGYTYAERGIAALSPEIEQRLNAGVDLKDAAALVGKDGVGLMYWYATNLGKWGNAQDITVILRYKDRIYNMMSRVLELEKNYFHGAPDRYFGTYYAVAPTFAGGDLDKSWEHFQESLKIESDYPATYNLIAEFYAPKKQDAALFNDMVTKVQALPMDALPGLEPEMAIEKRKAELLIKRRDAGDFPF